jgi:biotin carboxyl carrier protein
MAMTVEATSDVEGTVLKVSVEPGAEVSEGDELVVLESTLMESTVLAPRDGRVVALLVAQGDTVRKGQVLARLEA